MRKTAIIILIVLPFLIHAQNPIQPVLKSYFRTNPFDINFSTFIISLQKDPWFSIEEYSRRTDTTFFFLTGTYKNFNPFKYQAKEIRLSIAEQQLEFTDSLHSLDTIINIQIQGFTDITPGNRNLILKEYNRFQNKFADSFWKGSYDKIENEGNLIAEAVNLFIYPFSISPITFAWGEIKETKELTFTITLRCKIRENIANLILTPGEMSEFH